MNRLIVLCLAALLIQSSQGQTPASGLEETVRVMLYSSMWEGRQVKELRRGGDAVAVALTRVIKDNDLTSHEIEVVLGILKESFFDLASVAESANHEPRTTLIVLRYLDRAVSDRTLKDHIALTKKTIVESFARSALGSPVPGSHRDARQVDAPAAAR